MTLYVSQTRQFEKQKRKLPSQLYKKIDDVVKSLQENPKLGVKKVGDLDGVWVYKQTLNGQQYLFAYTWNQSSLTLLYLGVHENFYRDLKRSLN